jgi:nucleoside-diphosphate-sugar epimerase
MKTLVTGGGGFLGLYITEQLVERGDAVRVFCRGEYDRLNELGVECFQGDVRDFYAVSQACEGVECVFHIAAVPGIWGPWKMYHGVNTVGTENVIAACRKQGVSKLIYTSSPSVVFDGSSHLNANETCPYPDEESYLCHYPHSKALAEKAVLQANGKNGLSTVSLRPHLLWGPRDNHLIPKLIRRARSGRLRRVGDGTNLISISYVENAAQAHLQAADALSPDSSVAGEAYFINEPDPVNMWDWIDELLKLAGLPAIQKTISARAAVRLGAVIETVYSVFRIPGEPPMTRFLALQLSGSHSYDVSKAKRDFGYDPKISLEDGMRRVEPDLKRLAGE